MPNANMGTGIYVSMATIVTRAEDARVPPLRHLTVLRHQMRVNIRLFVHCPAHLRPDLLSEVQADTASRSGGVTMRVMV